MNTKHLTAPQRPPAPPVRPPVSMVRVLYNLLFTICLVLSAPYYFAKLWRRGNWRKGFGERAGRYATRIKHALTNRHVIWLHAVSVGEVNICTQLIAALEKRLPNLKVVVSTTTTTGMAELQKKLPGHIEKIYYPIDRARWVARALSVINPCAVVLIEAEIWPNFLWQLHDRQVPVFLVNARLSEKSFRGYRRFRFLFEPLFAGFKAVGVQDDRDAGRVRELGASREAVHLIGNLKFDAAELDRRRVVNVGLLLGQLGLEAEAPILVGGSTHAGEEKLLAEIFLRLRKDFPGLFLLLAPRHQERGKEVGRELEALDVPFVFRSELTPARQFKPGEIQCLLINSTGELKYFYEPATLIFIGKSLTAEGGQNPIEAGVLGKPLIFGPHMENFAAIAAKLVGGGGAIQVRDGGELERTLAQLLREPARREEIGRQALRIVRENQGAMGRTLELIVKHFEGSEVYVAR